MENFESATMSGASEQVVAAQVDEGAAVETSSNPVDDGQGRVVAPEENNEASLSVKKDGQQSRSDNTAARTARLAAERQTEERITRKFNEAISKLGMTHPVTGQPITNMADLEALDIDLEARKTGRTYEQVSDQRKMAREMEDLRAENQRLKREENQRHLNDDLARIKAAFPDCKANSPVELGIDFVRMMAAGKGELDPVTVYGVLDAKAKASLKQVPPPLGSVKADKPGAGGEFFTEAELDALTPSQLKNPAVYEKAMRSYDKLIKK